MATPKRWSSRPLVEKSGVLCGPSWTKRCPSRPFADKRFSSWSFVVLRGPSWSFAALRGPSRPFADKRFSSWSFAVLRGPSRSFAVLRGPSRSFAALRGPSRIKGFLRGPSWSFAALRGQKRCSSGSFVALRRQLNSYKKSPPCRPLVSCQRACALRTTRRVFSSIGKSPNLSTDTHATSSTSSAAATSPPR